jgi:uncharacterized protein involved in type VI secretion and phage assembly
MPEKERFYGKYRGVVVANVDPESRARIRATVPNVYGSLPSAWALPCLPAVGPNVALSAAGLYAVPKIGSWVWIEFEQGDPEHPIWSGGFFNEAVRIPRGDSGILATKTILQSVSGHALIIDDTAGITLQLVSGQKLQLTPLGVTIEVSPLVKLEMAETGITLKTSAGLLSISATGISLTNNQGSIDIMGKSVMLNKTALQVD